MPRFIAAVTMGLVTAVLMATPALAQLGNLCRGDSRDVERELSLRSGQLSNQDRILMERRLSEAGGLCGQDPSRGSSDLEQLRRDLIQQAQRPNTIPPEGGLPWTHGGPGMHPPD